MASEKKTPKKAQNLNAFIDTKYIPLDNKIKIVIALVLIIVPIVLFYFLLYSPNVKKIQGLTTQKTNLIAEIEKAKKAAAELENVKASIAEIEALFKETATLLPKDKEIPDLLRGISDLGKGAGLDFLSFKPGPEAPKDFYAEIPIDIQIDGPYHNMGYFLDQVSKLERIVTVDNIQMGGGKKEGAEMLLKSTCRLKTYRFTGIQTAQPEVKGKAKPQPKK
ncbi:MAG TPA: pilus assembly protein PilO [Desulfobulbaceae bacterium]|nr:pilus assembly protein PilO [Desulfobulbaceae bacterium]